MTHLEKVLQARSLSLRLRICRTYHPHPCRPERVPVSSLSPCCQASKRVSQGNRPFHSSRRLTTNTIMDNTNILAAAYSPIHDIVSLPSCHCSLPSITNSFVSPKTDGRSGEATLSNNTVQVIPSNSNENGTRSTSDLLSTYQLSRLIMASRCSATMCLGEFTIRCPCKAGIFNMPLETPIDVACKRCTHLLSNHEDVSSPIEGMASFRPIHISCE